jgi:hypothetical protein
MREIFSMATSVQLYYEWHTLTGNIIQCHNACMICMIW